MTLLQLKGLTGGYGQTLIVRDVNLKLDQGKIMCLLGRNGVGKSTLLKLIMGVLRKFSGEVIFDGNNLDGFHPYQVANLGVSYAPQDAAIFPQLSVEQNLLIGFNKKRLNWEKETERALSYFPILKERFYQQAGTLSGGEKKMLLVARVMIRSPRLVILDEITEGVQPSVILKIADALQRMNEERATTILFVEQNVDFAFKIADTYAVINKGAIIDTREVKNSLINEVERYLTI